MQGAYLGPDFSQVDIEKRLHKVGARFHVFDEKDLLIQCAAGLNAGKALGWFQGRMEFGPRSLGARSILADARSPVMQSTLNLKVKYRESFRPFAPAVLAEDASDWFDLDCPSPYMLMVADVKAERRLLLEPELKKLFGIDQLQTPRSQIPPVTHVDFSARVQTVHFETNPRFHGLISKFKEITACPVIVNTSFNIRGEPIVNSPEDAFRCFMGTGIELLAIGNCLLRKEEQDLSLKCNYQDQIEDD
jgi:carbamoyltransferase